MEIMFVVSVLLFILFVTIVLVLTINYFTRLPESVEAIELREKSKSVFDFFFGSGGVAIVERVTDNLHRFPVLVNESSGTARTNEVIAVQIDFDEICVTNSWNDSVRIYDEEFNEMPSRISYQNLCSSRYLNSSNVTFIVNISANEAKRFYIYSINNTNTTPSRHNITLRGYLSLDESEGTLAMDSSGYVNNGTLVNSSNRCANSNCPVWTAGRFGNGIQLDGLDDYVNVSDSSSVNITGNTLTLSAWVRINRTASTDTTQTIISKTAASDSEQYVLLYTADSHGVPNRFRFDVRNSSATASIYTNGTYATTNTWIHVTGVYNSSRITIFINGSEMNSTTTAGDITGRASDVNIGRLASGGQLFNGTIDEVRIYSENVSISRISALGTADLLTTRIFPEENITAVSASRLNALRARGYGEVRAILGGDFDFRIEIRETR